MSRNPVKLWAFSSSIFPTSLLAAPSVIPLFFRDALFIVKSSSNVMFSKMEAYLWSRRLLSQRVRLSYSVGVREMLLELLPRSTPGVRGEGEGEWMGEP
jgi:hypothetical protein